MLAWLHSSEARTVVRRTGTHVPPDRLRRREDTVLAEAVHAVWRRMQSPKPLSVRRPGGYGTAVIRSILVRVVDLRDRSPDELPAWLGEQAGAAVSDGQVLDLWVRARIERAATGPDWLGRAAVAYVDLAVGDLVLTDDVPQPRSGATPAQARAWAALWLAGLHQLFPQRDTAATRKTRSRRTQVAVRVPRRCSIGGGGAIGPSDHRMTVGARTAGAGPDRLRRNRPVAPPHRCRRRRRRRPSEASGHRMTGRGSHRAVRAPTALHREELVTPAAASRGETCESHRETDRSGGTGS